jgi:hypothetical protein
MGGVNYGIAPRGPDSDSRWVALLDRAKLTALERDEHVAEWIRLADEQEGVSVQLAQKLSSRGRDNEGGTT